jgi:UrcA family protein
MTRKLIFAAAAFAGAATFTVGLAQAGEITVTVKRPALEDPAYVEALYDEVRSAAIKACREELQGSIIAFYAMNECVGETVESAIAEIGAPMLTAYANGEFDALEVAAAD